MKAVIVSLLLAAGSAAAQVKYEEILKSPGENWLTYSGDYASTRYSPLRAVNRQNVGSLTPKWIYPVEGARRLETSPLVYKGVMYVSNTNAVDALDAKTGRRIWRYKTEAANQERVNKGVALLDDRVFLSTSDAHLIALHAATGNVLWDREYAPSGQAGY